MTNGTGSKMGERQQAAYNRKVERLCENRQTSSVLSDWVVSFSQQNFAFKCCLLSMVFGRSEDSRARLPNCAGSQYREDSQARWVSSDCEKSVMSRHAGFFIYKG